MMDNVNNVESHLNSQQHVGDRNYSLVRHKKKPATVSAVVSPTPPPTPPHHVHVATSLPGQPVQCPFCPYGHDRVSAVLMHLERGNCPGIYPKRSDIFNAVCLCDDMGTITNLKLHQPTRESSWDPKKKLFSCALCNRGFQTVGGLADHMNSEFHEFEWYHCPNADGCVSEFGLLSALMAHLEDQACGWKSFKELQEHGHVVLDPMRLR
ncbi:uncharacterized protein F5Z01DRAFT_669642 [Emericellopsis atlantica]|uniref:C2H2-type domain-containing protein n=1 Tax=Emericellopsis atlantica TaxID=2614577 RepID=A0A9P7ZW60_9HYPO|nr:uncharacterized protein F5Z01DRAFT_669642 [Emericellopsis atlantica]KAG9258907.1 hypothetical protein F5Z01DRAFT_669642 [Emericellopsis atlantica]